MDETNGMIRSYVVTYFPTSNSSAPTVEESVLGNVTSFNASGLDPFTNYTFEVVAVTVGPGPPDSIVVQTAEAGESFYQCIHMYHSPGKLLKKGGVAAPLLKCHLFLHLTYTINLLLMFKHSTVLRFCSSL